MMSMQGSLRIERMCQLAQVRRAGLYRSLREQRPVEEEMELRSAIQQIAVEHRRRYGYRRISAELRRRGMLANHKRVARIMREDNLLAMQPRQFIVFVLPAAGELAADCEVAPFPIKSRAGLTHLHKLTLVDEQKLSFGVDKTPDQPRTGNAIDLNVLASNPLH
jgi:hypothetical protein